MSFFILPRVDAAPFTHSCLSTRLSASHTGLSPQSSAGRVSCTLSRRAVRLKEHCNATLIGHRARSARQPATSPPDDSRIRGGARIHIDSTRLKDISNGMV